MNSILKIIILLIVFGILWHIYTSSNIGSQNDMQFSKKIMDVPKSIKCFFSDQHCNEANLDAGSVVQLIVYFIIGLMVPNHYVAIIIISIIIEIAKPFFGYRSKYVVNPIINFTGYLIGSALSHQCNKKQITYNYRSIA